MVSLVWKYAISVAAGFTVYVDGLPLFDVPADGVSSRFEFEISPRGLEEAVGEGELTHVLLSVTAYNEQSESLPSATRLVPVWGADLDRSGRIDFFDLIAFAHCWNGLAPWTPGACERADVDASGVLTILDYVMFTRLWRDAWFR